MATLRHETKSSTRKAERKAARKVRAWSADRPSPADVDLSVVQQAAELLKAGTGWEQADKTGLCQSTIYRYRNGDVRFPRFNTLQMIAAANGGRMVFVRNH